MVFHSQSRLTLGMYVARPTKARKPGRATPRERRSQESGGGSSRGALRTCLVVRPDASLAMGTARRMGKCRPKTVRLSEEESGVVPYELVGLIRELLCASRRVELAVERIEWIP